MNKENFVKLDFKINNEIVSIHVPCDDPDALYLSLTNDDDFTIAYIRKLIKTHEILMGTSLQYLSRYNDGVEQVLYQHKGEEVSLSDHQNSQPRKNEPKGTEWGTVETKFLLDKYATYIIKVGPFKSFKNKKTMWEKIATELASELNIQKTPLQVENRYKTVCKRKKEAVEHNAQSGASRVNVPFEEELAVIAAIDDSVEPEVMRSATKVYIKEKVTKQNIQKEVDQKNKPSKSITNVLIELHNAKEEAKERRHREKMEILQNLFKKE